MSVVFEQSSKWAGSVLVRPAKPEDMENVQSIYAHHVRHGFASFETSPPSLEEMLERRTNVLRLGLPYLVAEAAEGIVGYCYAGAYRSRQAYRYTVENSVYLAPDRVGSGIGSSLLESLIRDCEAGPWRQMLAVIGDSGNLGSIALHRKFGFEYVGTIRAAGFKLDRWVDTVLMQRHLGLGDSNMPDAVKQVAKEQ